VNRISLLCSIVLSLTLTAIGHSVPTSNISTPITLPIQSIRSNGSVIPQSFSKDKIDLLERELDNIMAATQTRGISASVGIPDKGIWCDARGVTGNAGEERISPDLSFYAGSIGKMFTAVVILKLAEEDQLSTQSTVAKWFPEMRQAIQITIDHLLTHTSGIPAFEEAEEYGNRPVIPILLSYWPPRENVAMATSRRGGRSWQELHPRTG
jgi:CubicO group peptidase (beta-lactamase class C family)